MRIALAEVDLAVMGAEARQVIGQRQGVGVRACVHSPRNSAAQAIVSLDMGSRSLVWN